MWDLGFRVSGLGCVYSVSAVGAPFTLGIGAHLLIARFRQHVVTSQLGLKGGLLLLSARLGSSE